MSASTPGWLAALASRPDVAEHDWFASYVPPEGVSRRSAVLMLFGPDPSGGEDVVLTERAHTLRAHPGQVSFPGGGIDPEDDGELQVVPPGPLPERVEILARMRELLGPAFAEPRRVQIHYLGQRVEVEIILPSAPAAEALEMLQSRRKAWLAEHPHYRNIRVFVETAP